MKNSKNISVICPFFNEQNIISAALKLMVKNLSKEFDNWELVLVDDGSTDNSLSIVLKLAQNYSPKVRILSCARNQGRWRAVKNGVDAAIGDIIGK